MRVQAQEREGGELIAAAVLIGCWAALRLALDSTIFKNDESRCGNDSPRDSGAGARRRSRTRAVPETMTSSGEQRRAANQNATENRFLRHRENVCRRAKTCARKTRRAGGARAGRNRMRTYRGYDPMGNEIESR